MSNLNHEERQESEVIKRPDELEGPVNVANLKKELLEARAKADENLAGWQRAQADFSNFKRRLEQDRDEAIKYAQAGLVLKILPVLDDFERAIGAVPPEQNNQPWVDGIIGIARKLFSTLESQGLSEIKAQGEPFDPCLHEAVMQAPGIEGMVVQELQKGYRIQDRVLRASRVAVGNGSETRTETAED